MPLCVLLWILVLIPAAMLGWLVIGLITEMDADLCIHGLVLLGILLVALTPQLLWYKSVRDVMMPSNPPVLCEAVDGAK